MYNGVTIAIEKTQMDVIIIANLAWLLHILVHAWRMVKLKHLLNAIMPNDDQSANVIVKETGNTTKLWK